jgi:5-methylcytosine-specific restriction endonuclease McrA
MPLLLAQPSELSDRDLLSATIGAAGVERHATVDLIALLGEVDARRLYLGEGCSSLFTYCTQVLRLSEHAAYHRIEAARTARQFPVVLELLANGAVTLTTVALLRPHLSDENHERLLDAARGKSKRDVEHQIACLAPRPDVRTLVRKAPMTASSVQSETPALDLEAAAEPSPASNSPAPRPARAVVAPVTESRYLFKVTVGADTHAKLRRAQDLLRHVIPNGDPALVLDRALTLLVDQLERRRIGKADRPRAQSGAPKRSARRTRLIPAEVRRAVWARDSGRCGFEGAHGRCTETGRLEFHHVIPFARGGPTTVSNLSLRCRAHNQFEADRLSGP